MFLSICGRLASVKISINFLYTGRQTLDNVVVCRIHFIDLFLFSVRLDPKFCCWLFVLFPKCSHWDEWKSVLIVNGFWYVKLDEIVCVVNFSWLYFGGNKITIIMISVLCGACSLSLSSSSSLSLPPFLFLLLSSVCFFILSLQILFTLVHYFV